MEAIKGAEGLLTNHNVWYLMTECNVDIIEEKGKQEYLRWALRLDYNVCITGWLNAGAASNIASWHLFQEGQQQ